MQLRLVVPVPAPRRVRDALGTALHRLAPRDRDHLAALIHPRVLLAHLQLVATHPCDVAVDGHTGTTRGRPHTTVTITVIDR